MDNTIESKEADFLDEWLQKRVMKIIGEIQSELNILKMSKEEMRAILTFYDGLSLGDHVRPLDKVPFSEGVRKSLQDALYLVVNIDGGLVLTDRGLAAYRMLSGTEGPESSKAQDEQNSEGVMDTIKATTAEELYVISGRYDGYLQVVRDVLDTPHYSRRLSEAGLKAITSFFTGVKGDWVRARGEVEIAGIEPKTQKTLKEAGYIVDVVLEGPFFTFALTDKGYAAYCLIAWAAANPGYVIADETLLAGTCPRTGDTSKGLGAHLFFGGAFLGVQGAPRN